jgi:hypothetical protein
MKGKTMELGLFIASMALCVVAGVYYLRAEDSDLKAFSDTAGDLKGAMKSVETAQATLKKDQELLAEQSAVLITSLNDRVKKIEEDKKRTPDSVKLTLTEPVRVNLVYRKSEPKIPTKIPGPLLKRAGIKSDMSQ